MINKSYLNFIESQKLYRLGVKSESGFYYNKKDKQLHWSKDLFLGMSSFEITFVPAYTDADLIELLPGKLIFKKGTNHIDSYDLKISKGRSGENYLIEYTNVIPSSAALKQFNAATEVRAKANMITWLIQKKLINIL